MGMAMGMRSPMAMGAMPGMGMGMGGGMYGEPGEGVNCGATAMQQGMRAGQSCRIQKKASKAFFWIIGIIVLCCCSFGGVLFLNGTCKKIFR